MKNLRGFIFGLVSISLFAVTLIYLIRSEQHLKPTDYVSCLASIGIVFLTAAYVFITSGQLKTMRNQLDEMKTSREHTSQPIPFVTPSNLYLERPRLYYSPPEKEYSGHSRFHITCDAINPGNAPALSVNICACVMLQQNVGSDCGALKSAMEYLDILSVSGQPITDRKISFMFPDDREANIIDAIRSCRPDKAPILRLCVAYKNMLGACFACRQAFQLFYNTEEQDNVLENWQSQVSAFDSLLKKEIAQLNKLQGRDTKAWVELLDDAKKKYEALIIGEDQKVIAVQIPTSFTAFPITEARYMKFLSKSHYGQFMPAQDECLAQKVDEDALQ